MARVVVSLTVAMLVAMVGIADSATLAEKCAVAKLKAAGRKTNAKVACYAKALAKGAAADPICLSKAESKYATAFQKAESQGGCVTPGDAAAVEVMVDSCVTGLVTALPATTSTSTTSTTSTTTTILHFFAPCLDPGGGGPSTCNGICTGSDVCQPSFEVQSSDPFACLCYPFDVTPCTGSAYPTCGGACTGDEVCQAMREDSIGATICGCVSPTSSCESPGGAGTCTLGRCPAGSACSYIPSPAPLCGCGVP
jgi:hypothetical protein